LKRQRPARKGKVESLEGAFGGDGGGGKGVRVERDAKRRRVGMGKND